MLEVNAEVNAEQWKRKGQLIEVNGGDKIFIKTNPIKKGRPMAPLNLNLNVDA